jgi:hypothetical protein
MCWETLLICLTSTCRAGPLPGNGHDLWVRVTADGLTSSLRLEAAGQGTTRHLRDARSVDWGGRCALWTTTPATSAPTCDVSTQRRCRFRCCRRSGRYLSIWGLRGCTCKSCHPKSHPAVWVAQSPAADRAVARDHATVTAACLPSASSPAWRPCRPWHRRCRAKTPPPGLSPATRCAGG